MKTDIYNQKGKKEGTIELSDDVFGLSWNSDLVHQVAVSMQANSRTPVAHTKDRSEVSGGGKKPWQQKGTGRARHGSIRSPIWVGGGVTFGPRNEKDYSKKINKKMRIKALYTVLSRKLKDGEILFVDSIKTSEPKTKTAKEVISSVSAIEGFEGISTKKKNTLYIANAIKDDNTEKSFRNFNNIIFGNILNMNILDIMNNKYLIITDPENSVKIIENKMSKNNK